MHYTNVEDNNQIMAHARALQDAGLDYDVFGVSYYSFWHGTMENLTEVLTEIRDTYGKKTCVLETSYAYTADDGDGSGNSISETDLIKGYAATVQSQAANVRDVMAAANKAGSMGVFYWEGAWIPVGSAENAAENAKLWEQYGSGWASSYAAGYDPEDAGKHYGGSSWDNQAFFDFEGKKLPSLDVFKYVNYGTICEPAIDYLDESVVKVNIGEALTMPESVYAVYNDRSKSGEVFVTWDETQTAAINTSTAGEYVIDGTLADGRKVSATVKVANINYVENPSFEEKNMSMWKVTHKGADPTDVQAKESDAMTGTNSFHFWDNTAFEFTLGQTISGLPAGSYTLTANIQGGDAGADAVIYIYAEAGDNAFQSESVGLAGWCNWQIPEITDIPLDGSSDITIGLYVSSAAGGWGTVDDFYLYKQ